MTSETIPTGGQEVVIPLLEEEVSVAVRPVTTGRVRVHVTTTTREEHIDEGLETTKVEVERVPIGRVVESHPPIREEADVTIIPVVEKVLVLERRLVLKEEVRVRRVRTEERHAEAVVLRVQNATIERAAG